MSLNNVEEVGTSLPDVQSREMQILEEVNDANVQQKFNTSSCCVCNKDATDKYYLAVNVTFKCIAYGRSYRHANFNILLKRTPTGLVDLSSDGVDILINDIKEHLVEIETINNLLREENQHLRGENIQNKNNLTTQTMSKI